MCVDACVRMCVHSMCVCVCVCVKQANLALITLYLFHQCCALAYFHSYKFTTLPSVVIDDPLILAHLWRLRARKEVSERQWHHFTAYDANGTFHVLKTISVFAIKSRESKFVNVTTQRTKQKINYNVVKTS